MVNNNVSILSGQTLDIVVPAGLEPASLRLLAGWRYHYAHDTMYHPSTWSGLKSNSFHLQYSCAQVVVRRAESNRIVSRYYHSRYHSGIAPHLAYIKQMQAVYFWLTSLCNSSIHQKHCSMSFHFHQFSCV